jgi:large subunit ribosomal protein L31
LPTLETDFIDMKSDIHPQVNNVVFVDTSCGAEFITTSTLKSDETRVVDGVEHMVINVEISSASHPFYTGKQVLLDTARRVEKFEKRAAKQAEAAEVRKGKRAKAAKRAEDTAEETTEAPKAKKKKAPAAEVATEEAPVVEEAKVEEAPAETTEAETPAVEEPKAEEEKQA